MTIGLAEIAIYAVALAVLGAFALLPTMYIGRKIRARFELTFVGIFLLNALNVVSVLWAIQAGRALAANAERHLRSPRQGRIPKTHANPRTILHRTGR